MENREIRGQEAEGAVSAHYDTRLPNLPWSRRIQIPIIAALVYSVIRVLGPTLRFEAAGRAPVDNFLAKEEPCIWAFWHRVIVPISWYARNREIVVMNTTAFDGQWTRKVIEWLGFGTAQGSSSRGPRYVAKVGPVLLARMTGAPIMVFHIGVDRGKTIEKTWDHFLLPGLFARAVLIGGNPIFVPQDADAAMIERKHKEMQKELERVRDIAEGWFSFTDEEREKYREEFGK